MIMEQRDTRESDWALETLSAPKVEVVSEVKSEPAAAAAPVVIDDPELRKKLFNAPKRIPKIEQQLAKYEKELTAIDEDMLSHGNDVSKLTSLQKQKDSITSKVDSLMEEWDELEALMAKHR